MVGLLPFWPALLTAVLFALVALSHLRHMAQADGQRRPWHACHVLLALSMICMEVPVSAARLPEVAVAWRVALAVAGLLAAAWSVWGASGSLNPVWLLTALDMGAMLYLWSPHPAGTAVSATVALYLLVNAGVWTFDAHRRWEREPSLLRWLPMGDAQGGAVTLPAVVLRADTLLGDLDISPSMILMSLGMAAMLVVS
jgi:hypothetical protein